MPTQRTPDAAERGPPSMLTTSPRVCFVETPHMRVSNVASESTGRHGSCLDNGTLRQLCYANTVRTIVRGYICTDTVLCTVQCRGAIGLLRPPLPRRSVTGTAFGRDCCIRVFLPHGLTTMYTVPVLCTSTACQWQIVGAGGGGQPSVEVETLAAQRVSSRPRRAGTEV